MRTGSVRTRFYFPAPWVLLAASSSDPKQPVAVRAGRERRPLTPDGVVDNRHFRRAFGLNHYQGVDPQRSSKYEG
jgi:hypothetical protein